VTICKSEGDMVLRIRDRGGGVSYEHLCEIWKYAYTTVNEDEDVRSDQADDPHVDAMMLTSRGGYLLMRRSHRTIRCYR